MNQIRILVADDHDIVRKGLISILGTQSDMEVIGEAENGLDAIDKCESLKPDVVVLDIAMPGMNGLDAITIVKEKRPNLAIVALSMYDNDTYIQRVFKSGALAYVLKASAASEIYAAIRAAHRGKYYLSEEIREKVVAGFMSQSRDLPETNRYESLTPQEKQVFLLLVQGATTKEMADKLFVSPKTIEKHRTAISQKLGIKNRIGLTYYAIKNEIVNIDLVDY